MGDEKVCRPWVIFGADGRVGAAVTNALRASGCDVRSDRESLSGAVVFDARWAGADWQSYVKAFAASAALLVECEAEKAAAVILCGSWWAGMPETRGGYGAIKRLLMQLAAEQNYNGRVPCIVDFIGLQLAEGEPIAVLSGWELLLKQESDQLAKRLLAALEVVL